MLKQKMANNMLKRKIADKVFILVLRIFTFLAVLPLVCVLSYIIFKGYSSLSWSIFTNLPAPVGETGGGMGNAIVGTLIIVALGTLLSCPIGVFAGLWLAMYGKGKRGFLIRYCADVLSGVPTVVLGMVVYILFVLPTQRLSAMAGGVALAVVMIPSITRTTEEMVKMVPRSLTESALALGIPQYRVSWSIVLRSAWNGIFSGLILAIARALGETAPLLFTSFSNLYWNFSLNDPMASMTVQIYSYAISPYEDWQKMAWAGALLLVASILLVTVLVKRFSKRVIYG
ncbi:MAG: phosphate ABC transporter permease PstA [Candidatus Margulisiibacteriota bacterium]|jgi:phosphate transport system permease protein